jgi:error-prone DNA polymerase
MRPFASIEELARRVPSLTRADLRRWLSRCPELNRRRDSPERGALAGGAGYRKAGPLLEELDRDEDTESPLRAMEPHERMVADYASTGVTVGRHPMAHCRPQLRAMKIVPARDLPLLRHGITARIAGCVIARQRPGTAHGFIFLSIED